MNLKSIVSKAKNEALTKALSDETLQADIAKQERKLDYFNFSNQEKARIFHKMADAFNHRAEQLNKFNSNH